MLRIGIDIGGTFTDFVLFSPEGIQSHKVLSTPDAPHEAVLQGLGELGISPEVLIIHGSTVATNAFLERKGAKVALLTTAGFEDVMEIGRQDRMGIYDLKSPKPEPLVPREGRLGVRERVAPGSEVLLPLTEEEMEKALKWVREYGAEAVAICLLHAYEFPEHEARLRQKLAPRQGYVYLSSEVNPEYREYERTSTTVISAYIAPKVDGYLKELQKTMPRLRVMASSGGHLSPQSILSQPAAMMLSGPAGGAVAAHHLAKGLGLKEVVTFDMGGTSTDVALLPGEIPLTREGLIGGLPLRMPRVDIHTVGAGGGSLARFDPGGSLQVGPQSAGARPGPASYGLGGERVTVTDAHVFLKRIPAAHFLGGRLTLSPEAAEEAFRRLQAEGRQVRSQELSLEDLAEGVIQVAEATMVRAIRRVTAEKGYDPAHFALVSFGGAGGLHAVSLARAMGMKEILFPPAAGTLSAWGLALAPAISHHMQSFLEELRPEVKEPLEKILLALEAAGREVLSQEGFAPEDLSFEASLDLRYRGEAYELAVPWQGDIPSTVALFHQMHQQFYLQQHPGDPVECVSLHGRTFAPLPDVPLPVWEAKGPWKPALEEELRFAGETLKTPFYLRESWPAGQALRGPAVILEDSSTLLIPPGALGEMDERGVVHVGWEDKA
ncbi:MAG: hydantoinase/oxoprolinase family protein [Bacillota bacterium]|nr:hydantoinase/oxoprolinase family protein [Bacillota bacterium]